MKQESAKWAINCFSTQKQRYFQTIQIVGFLKQVVRQNQNFNQDLQKQSTYLFLNPHSPHLDLIYHMQSVFECVTKLRIEAEEIVKNYNYTGKHERKRYPNVTKRQLRSQYKMLCKTLYYTIIITIEKCEIKLSPEVVQIVAIGKY